jgi:hypothetical protein
MVDNHYICLTTVNIFAGRIGIVLVRFTPPTVCRRNKYMLSNSENAGAMAAGRDDYTSVASFVFDLEGHLGELDGLSTTLELLLVEVLSELRQRDRGRAAAIGLASASLRQEIEDLACRYEQLDRLEVLTTPTRLPEGGCHDGRHQERQDSRRRRRPGS